MYRIDVYYISINSMFPSFEETFYGYDEMECYDRLSEFEFMLSSELPGGIIDDYYKKEITKIL